jgi:Lectin C-type domain
MIFKHAAAVVVFAGLMTVPAVAAPVQWAGNGHWYEYVDATTYSSFADALNAASGLSHNGEAGYLATITSADEQSFLNTIVSVTSWLGGSDAADEGNWTWRSGPENGSLFTYTNWADFEPNNCCNGEHGLLGWWSGDRWNDIYDGYSSFGIVVEYNGASSDVPLPAGLPLLIGALGVLGIVSRSRKPV